MAEPDVPDFSRYYKQLVTKLHGVTTLSLTASPDCGEGLVDAIVAAASSLRNLDYANRGSSRAQSANGDLQHSVRCSSLNALAGHAQRSCLSHVRVTYVLELEQLQQGARVSLVLRDAEQLCSFKLDLTGRRYAGDQQYTVMLQAFEGAAYDITGPEFDDPAESLRWSLERSGGAADDSEPAGLQRTALRAFVWNIAGDNDELGSME
jgi:hypothetical protein